ncbi:hypothetical protein GF369_01000 [Candidatus Peregrinibacteria bacterium]|nr:hypothetical protein [Candidatus Peregrinibacteria bacterium]
MTHTKPKLIQIVLLVLTISLFVGYASIISRADSAINPYDTPDKTVQEVEKFYHKRINEIFNAKLTLLKKGKDGNGTAEIPDNDECAENNYGTYCLAMTAAKEYDLYSSALNKRKAVTNPQKGDTIDQLALRTISEHNEIKNELDRSRKALDIAIKTYDELAAAHRMHLQYEKIIKNITKYNKKLIEFREEVEKLPGKFIDATTTQCT